jgi:hypothetical protein
MNTKKLLFAALGVVASSVAALAQQTFTFAGPIDSAPGLGTQFFGENPVSTAYYVGANVDLISGSIDPINAGTWASEARIRLINSAFPSANLVIQPYTLAAVWTGNLPLTPGTVVATGGLISSLVPSASTWTVEFFESFDDGTDLAPDATWTGPVSFSTTVGVAPPSASQTFTINGDSIDTLGDPSNTIINLGTHSGPAYVVDNVRYESGSITVLSGTAATESRILLRNSSNPYLSLVITPYTTGGSQSVLARTASLAFPAYQASPLITTSTAFYLNLYGQTIPTGSTWTAELFETSNGPVATPSLDVAEATHTNLVFSLLPGTGATPTPPATGTAPTTFTDLGEINTTTAPESTPITLPQAALTPAGTVVWYKLSIPSATSYTNFLDIYATPISGQAGVPDTEFALYDNTGVLRATDDDDSVGFMSQLAIGGAAAPRAALLATTLPSATVGSVFSGIDASATLEAGTYWLAVTLYNANFNHGFVTLPSTSSNVNTWNLNLRTNIAPGAAAASISGNLELLSTVGSGGTESIDWTLTDGVNSYNGSVSVADAGSSAYSINVPGGAPNGAYTLKFKGGTFLSKTLNVTLTGSSLTGQNAALVNGDIDQDTEVGPGDFEAVVAQFGGPGDADVDNDGEVGPSDFETVIANFGLGDE